MSSAIAGAVDAVMAAWGEPMVLKRPVIDGQSAIATLAVQGKRLMKSRSGGASEFSGSASETALMVRIGNSEIDAAGWPGPPKIGDMIQIGGRDASIDKVDTRVVGAVTLAHFLYVTET